MENASAVAGDAITKMIAVIYPMKLVAKNSNAKMEPSNVHQDTALQLTSVAMVIVIVVICPMKKIVHHDSQEDGIVLKVNSSARITFACRQLISVMEVMIVQMDQMKHQMFVRISIATH